MEADDDDDEWSSSPIFLFKGAEDSERLYLGYARHYAAFDELESVSPFYRMAGYSGELPEECRILGELSRMIKTNSPKLKEAARILNRYLPYKAEEKLWELIRSE